MCAPSNGTWFMRAASFLEGKGSFVEVCELVGGGFGGFVQNGALLADTCIMQ
jgi:hypothetical protein